MKGLEFLQILIERALLALVIRGDLYFSTYVILNEF